VNFHALSPLCLQELELEKFITHTVPFSEINHAFDLMAKGEGIRCIIRMEN
jgi:alcohol dehydrogenase class-P